MKMRNNIEKEISCILEDTTKLNFPVGSRKEMKKKIIIENKIYVEERMQKVLPESFPKRDILEKMWDEAVEYSNNQFKALSEKRRINGFYLQELIHCYAEKIGKEILANI